MVMLSVEQMRRADDAVEASALTVSHARRLGTDRLLDHGSNDVAPRWMACGMGLHMRCGIEDGHTMASHTVDRSGMRRHIFIV